MLERTEYVQIPESKNVALRSISREKYMVSEVDLAWLAGILDGEGNLSAGTRKHDNGKYYLDVKVRISNCDIRMIHKIGKILEKLDVRFFHSLMNKNRKDWKTGLNIEVARQGSTKKLLTTILPYLVNKKATAQAIIDIVDYVKSLPKVGNGKSNNYVEHVKFQNLMDRYRHEHTWYFDPSTTTRRAGEAISLDGIV